MEQKFKKYGEDENDFDAGFKIPEVKNILSDITETLRLAHQEEEESDKKNGKPKRREKRKGTICCCGSPGCSIGPMIEKEETRDV